MTKPTCRIYRVRRPDGSLFVPSDSRRDIPVQDAAVIHSRFVADMFAEQCGGTVETFTVDEEF